MYPTQWDNEYFNNLLLKNWENFTGPGVNATIEGDAYPPQQWKVVGTDYDPTKHDQSLMMYTTDIAVRLQISLYILSHIFA